MTFQIVKNASINLILLLSNMSKVNFERYQEFVSAVTSDASTNFVDFADRIGDLDRQGANIERLLTSGVGINAEGGEFLEIIKKMVFQGKPWNEDNREHLIIELGDILWYVAQATMALGISFDEVIATNVKKLEKRYPGGEFDVFKSENRAAGDR
jgi:NTP pyrophosphatase (non-canonical NTP hydrolase)